MSKISVGFFLFVLFAYWAPYESKGVTLFKNNCADCHLTPDFRDLPKSIWTQQILPEMGHRLRIQDTAFDPLKGLTFPEMEAVISTGAFPAKAAISPEDWELLKNYILHVAPCCLIFHEIPDPPGELRLYSANPISLDSNGRSSISMLKFDERSEKMIAEDISGNLYALDNGLRKKQPLDHDADGDMDIITVNGDNADRSAIKKPNHGMRIHLNQCDNSFKEVFFYPMPGETLVVARDIGQDGDVDMAILSNFPDYQGHESPIVYLENQDSKFFCSALSTAAGAMESARLFLMDAGDVDGDLDMVLSAFSLSFNAAPERLARICQKNDTDLMFLENTMKGGSE